MHAMNYYGSLQYEKSDYTSYRPMFCWTLDNADMPEIGLKENEAYIPVAHDVKTLKNEAYGQVHDGIETQKNEAYG